MRESFPTHCSRAPGLYAMTCAGGRRIYATPRTLHSVDGARGRAAGVALRDGASSVILRVDDSGRVDVIGRMVATASGPYWHDSARLYASTCADARRTFAEGAEVSA
jgi:hypothetical protein